ncbi:DMT family transporter [Massilia luteola]|uniref:DMT family transporter n=1 Tax=Massilia luteola TaxID=3081751 RepID=UPI002ACC1FBC|nr:DMT family transporter [Massilia sp. Gc5]
MTRTAWACALGAILLWAAFATLVRFAGNTPPLLLTGIALCCGSLASAHRWREWRVPAAVLGFGVASLFLYHASLVAAFRLAPIAEANLLNYLWPLLIVVLAPRAGGTGPRPRQLAGCAIAFAGAALVIAPSASTLSAVHLAGYALAVFAAFTWAVYSLLPARLPAYSSWATGGFCLGAGILAPGAHGLFETPYRPTGAELAAMAAIGAGPLGLAFVLWDRAMRTGRAATIGSLSYLTPVLSTLALAVTGAVAAGAWWRLAPALLLVVAGVRLAR